MYLDKPLQSYLDDLASAQPTPGGGSAAALSGALGAALASMVARLTLGKADYASVEPEIASLLQESERLRASFQQLMQADMDAYGRLSASFKMPRTTGEERAARSHAVQERLTEAALVPLEVAEHAAELIRCCRRIAEIGNANVLSDIVAGAAQAACAASSAAWMVRVNLRMMKDSARVQALEERLNAALDAVATGNQQVIDVVGGRK